MSDPANTELTVNQARLVHTALQAAYDDGVIEQIITLDNEEDAADIVSALAKLEARSKQEAPPEMSEDDIVDAVTS